MESTTAEPGRIRLWTLSTINVLAGSLLALAVVAFGGALLSASSTALALVALALVVAAAMCWRIRWRINSSFRESNAWKEVELLHGVMAEREATWAAVPGAAAAWDRHGQLLLATAAWRDLGLRTDRAPDQAELSVGEPPRVFTVERAEQPSGTRLVLLREVTREREALQAKDELLAIVGHELRTPLSSIKGYGQLMARQLATVQEQVLRLDQLIQDVMDTARAEGGRLLLRREPVSIQDLVTSAAERFRAAHPSRLVDKTFDAYAVVEGDPARLSQVMDNLLSNADKYSPPEAPISVCTSVDGDRVRIAIRDQGVGIAPEHLPRLFDRFYRVPGGDVAGPQGFGLGLSIVRDLVEAHGGRIEVTSGGPGAGSSFTIMLPVVLPISPEASQTAAVM
ncbi:MAG TPA: HAMP domain-containing sensor histidine kinase [Chloroflexota bacterium]